MQMQTLSFCILLSAFLLLFLSPPCATAGTPQDLLRSSCAQARYPTLCVQSLSNHVGSSMKPLDLAQAAVKVSLAHARTLSLYLNTLQQQARAASSSDRQRVAVSDCVAQISDSVTELNRTMNELRHLKMGTFQWQMSNAMTWTSTALTNGNACINGLNSSEVDENLKVDVKRRVTDVSMLTSNALYLIDRLRNSRSRNGKPRSNSKN
ncbi:Pectinesterase inhibitor domain [Sesbania bispinosa]|nr:Pectinesterase inhibitor domain [Sesbania bispinosa]